VAQQIARDEAGHIWDVSDPANPKLVSQGGSSPNVVMPAAPPEKKFVPDHPNLVYNPQDNTTTTVPGVPAPPPPKAPVPNFLPGQPGYVAGGDPEHPKAIPIEGAPAQLDASVRQKAIQGYQFSQLLKKTVQDLRQKFMAGPGKTSGVMASSDYLPLTRNKAFDSAADGARGIIGQTLQFTGGQLNTEHESEMNLGPFLPHSDDRDEVIKQKLDRLQSLAETGRSMAVQTLGGEPDENGNIKPVNNAPEPKVTNLPGANKPDIGLNGGNKTRAEIDPVLQAASKKIGSMVAAGVSDDKIQQYLIDNHINPADTNLNSVLDFRRTKDFSNWQKQNPGQAYPIGPSFYTKQVPMSGLRQGFNSAAATDLGGAMVAAPLAAANAITGDRLASISGDPLAKQGMDLMRENHTVSSLLGDVAGQASVEALAGRVPGAQNLLLSRWGRRGADALYGAYSGSGDDSGGDGLTGALTGAATNMAGGMFGRGLQKGTGRTMTGVKNASLQYLDNLGVPLTIGQIGHGSNNKIGHFVGGLEDRLAGLPGFDAVIGAPGQRFDQAFNSAAFKEAGGSGATGAAGLDELGNLRKGAYGFLNGTDIPLDAQFAGRNSAVRASIPDMPAFGKEVGMGLDQINRVSPKGILSGRDWQSALSDTRANKASIAGQPFANNATNGLSEIDSNLVDLAGRQGPAGTIDNLNAANKLHGQVETLAGALDNGPAQRADQLFSPQRLDDVSRVNARNFGGRMASLTGANRPFYELTQAGLKVKPKLTPDSGTAGRMWLVPLAASLAGGSIGGISGALGSENDRAGDALGGGELGAKYGALLGLAAMGPYSKAGQAVLQKALLGDRPDKVVKIGQYLVNKPKLAGMFGSGLARDYLYNLGQ